MQTIENQPTARIQQIQAAAMADLASVIDYAAAIGKCERSVWSYVRQGLPVTYIGRTAYIVLSKANAYWADRARQRNTPKRGRPAKRAA